MDTLYDLPLYTLFELFYRLDLPNLGVLAGTCSQLHHANDT